MPYIEPLLRELVDSKIYALADKINDISALKKARDGVLNYAVSSLIKELYKVNYTDLNAAIGVLECAKMEFYRRVVVKYENEKCAINGDVYEN